jgi:hypothetical protein
MIMFFHSLVEYTAQNMVNLWSSMMRNYSSWRFLRSIVPVEYHVDIERVESSLM